MTSASRRFVAGALLALVACRGPELCVEAPGPLYVDGTRANSGERRPFSYYGTASVDALPKDVGDRPDWRLQRSRTSLAIPAPVTPWVFPLDLPLELLVRPFVGVADQVVTVAPQPVEGQVTVGFQPEGLETLRTRAFAARAAR